MNCNCRNWIILVILLQLRLGVRCKVWRSVSECPGEETKGPETSSSFLSLEKRSFFLRIQVIKHNCNGFNVLFSVSIEQTGCTVGTFKKRLRPCVCNETSSGWQGKNNWKATQVDIKPTPLISPYFTDWRKALAVHYIWQRRRFFCIWKCWEMDQLWAMKCAERDSWENLRWVGI